MDPGVPNMMPPSIFASDLWRAVTPPTCALGESPFWHPIEQKLYWVDIDHRQILRADVKTGDVQTWDMPSEPGCIAPMARGGLVIALRDGVFTADDWGADLQRRVTLPYDSTRSRANDGKCDAGGRFWVGTIDQTRSHHDAALFCIDTGPAPPTGTPCVTCQITPDDLHATTANGLAFSPDGRTLYWADTPQHTVWAWDYDASGNTLGRRRVFAQFEPKPPGWQVAQPAQPVHHTPNVAACKGDDDACAYGGRPDGASVDVQGNYWVAMYEGQRVCQFSPDGSLRAEWRVPVARPTMPCFGGKDLQTLFVTSARPPDGHAGAAELAAFPLSGAVLAMPVDVPGLPVCFFG